MGETKTINYAKKTFLAMKNPYNTVDKVYPLAIEGLQEENFIGYLGVKNHISISKEVVQTLVKNGYFLHTLDMMSLGGRAIDTFRYNPITGRPMTGSSSCTALNVFYGINDIGVGSDGGGSVLNPALSLNLTGYISKFLGREYVDKFSKVSTDGIRFSPSNGLIARDLSQIERTVKLFVNFNENQIDKIRIGVPTAGYLYNGIDINKEIDEKIKNSLFKIEKVELDFSDIIKDRKEQIAFMQEALEKVDVLISPEGATDVNGLGDTVFGGMDENCKANQQKAGKVLTKVANMVGASAIVIPQNRLASGYLLSTKDDENLHGKLFAIAKLFEVKRNALLESYFLNLNNYFQKEFNEV